MSALAARPDPERDVDVNSLVLDVVNRKVRGMDTQIIASVTGGEIERTMEGASTLTLTVHDPHRALLRSGMFSYASNLKLDRLNLRLVKVAKQDDELTLTFEDRAVALLRQHKKPRKATRGKVNRAQFALSIVREVRPRIHFVCPELHATQREAVTAESQAQVTRHAKRSKGLNKSANLTVKGRAATLSQKRTAQSAMDAADAVNAPVKATLKQR